MANSLQWFRTETREGKTFVLDPLRRRYVALTPEEEVRQKTLCLLVEHLGVPAGRIAVEYSLKLNGLDKRADAVAFDAEGRALMVVECKAQNIGISHEVLAQALRYHAALQPKFLLLTNGVSTYCFKVKDNGLEALSQLPSYTEMLDVVPSC